jgi:leader peptidase (prepilin peptidase)/N-methyltransferase
MPLQELIQFPNSGAWGLMPLWLARAFVFAFGLLWGSFLNVVIYRVPRDMSVVRPASHCPGCGKPIAGYDNIPVFTWLLLRGRSRCCKTKISVRYPLVELMGGMLSLAVFEVVIMALPGATPAHRALAIYGADFILCLGLLSAAFIDAEHMFLPDSITIGGTVLGLATATLRGNAFVDSIIGAVAGFFGIWLPFIFLYKGLRGRTGMGLGDAKLVALAGAWFGWPGALITVLGGAVQGTVAAGIAYAAGWKPKLPDAVLEDIRERSRKIRSPRTRTPSSSTGFAGSSGFRFLPPRSKRSSKDHPRSTRSPSCVSSKPRAIARAFPSDRFSSSRSSS